MANTKTVKRRSAIGGRVNHLVEAVHEGSVYAAARDTGLPHPTLLRIVKGAVAKPREDVLQKISDFYGASMEWLKTGKGYTPAVLEPDPYNIVPQAEVRRWHRAAQLLGTEPKVRDAIGMLARPISAAIHNAPFRDDGKTPAGLRIRAEYRKAIELYQRAWLTLFDVWIDNWGVDRVREVLGGPLFEELESGFRLRPPMAGDPHGRIEPGATTRVAKKRR